VSIPRRVGKPAKATDEENLVAQLRKSSIELEKLVAEPVDKYTDE
jgi:hypothetical protein